MKGILTYIYEEFGISESLKELSDKKIVKILKDLGFSEKSDFKVNGGGVHANSEEIAMGIADEMVNTKYEMSYDEDENFKIVIFG